jgi:hypothetical protein
MRVAIAVLLLPVAAADLSAQRERPGRDSTSAHRWSAAAEPGRRERRVRQHYQAMP